VDFDPTKKNQILELAKLRRPIGRIILEYDPNTGRMGFNTEGLVPIEEIGCAQWFIMLRHEQVMEEAKKSVKIAPADSVPPPPRVS
jgi:hypothetical protein